MQEEEVKEAEERVKVAKEGVVEEQEEEEEQQQQAVVIVVVGRAEEDTWRLIIGFTRRMCVRRASTSSRTRLRFGSVSLPPLVLLIFGNAPRAVRVCLFLGGGLMREIVLIFGEHLKPYASASWKRAFFLCLFSHFWCFLNMTVCFHACVFSLMCIMFRAHMCIHVCDLFMNVS